MLIISMYHTFLIPHTPRIRAFGAQLCFSLSDIHTEGESPYFKIYRLEPRGGIRSDKHVDLLTVNIGLQV